MRDQPSTDGKVLGTIPQGTHVKLLQESGPALQISGRSGRWSQVDWKGTTGWVFGGFLKTDKADTPTADTLPDMPAAIAGFFCEVKARDCLGADIGTKAIMFYGFADDTTPIYDSRCRKVNSIRAMQAKTYEIECSKENDMASPWYRDGRNLITISIQSGEQIILNLGRKEQRIMRRVPAPPSGAHLSCPCFTK